MNEKIEIALARITVFILKALMTLAVLLAPAALEGLILWLVR